MLTITRYGQRPGHLFGGLGVICGLMGTGILLYLFFSWLFGPIYNRPLLPFGIMLVVLSAQLVTFGMLAEMFLFRSGPRPIEKLVAEVETMPPAGERGRARGPGPGGRRALEATLSAGYLAFSRLRWTVHG